MNRNCCCICRRLIQSYTKRRLSDQHKSNTVLKGWVKSVRKHKEVTFVKINDGTQNLSTQIVSAPELCPSNVELGSCIVATGKYVQSQGRKEEYELQAEEIKVLGECDPLEYPFKVKATHTADYTRNFIHLRSRTNISSAILRARNTASMAVHRYFQENGYVMIHTPIITTNDCEGAGEVFSVEPAEKNLSNEVENNHKDTGHHSSHADSLENPKRHPSYFKSPAFLTVSGQLHLEAIASSSDLSTHYVQPLMFQFIVVLIPVVGISKVYTFSPAFRAERSATRHHLAEFYMIEAELAFTQTLEDILEVMEGLIKYVTKVTMDESSEDIHYLHKQTSLTAAHQKSIESMITDKYLRISYDDAIRTLSKKNKKFEVPIKYGDDLKKEHEKQLVKQCGNVPVFLTDFPKELKPFYARQNEDERTVAGVDLLVPEVGELCGGTLREERYDALHSKLESLGLQDSLAWYLQLRQFGTCPHGGFGMGFDRYLQFLLNVSNIKDVTPFPRWTNHCPL